MKLFATQTSSTTHEIVTPTQTGGVVLSFDDIYTTDWLAYHNDYGIAQGWKATFMTIDPYTYQKADLKVLSDYGHEIGNHTNQHYYFPLEYLNAGNSALDYYNTYVKPQEDILIAEGIPKPTSFRFPYNRLSDVIRDDLLNNRGYKIVSPGTGAGFETPTTNTPCYYLGDKYPVAISTAHMPLDVAKYKELLDYAKANDLIFSFLLHNIGVNYTTFLRTILDYCVEIDLPFYTVSELADLSGSPISDVVIPTIGTLTLDSQYSNTMTISCTATDNDRVYGFDIYVDGLPLFRRYSSAITSFTLSIGWSGAPFVIGNTYEIKLKAIDRAGNYSNFSNILNVTL